MTLFACGKMLDLEGVHTVCIAKGDYGAVLYTDAGAFTVEQRDMPALLLKLELVRASGEFAYGGSQVGFPGAARLLRQEHETPCVTSSSPSPSRPHPPVRLLVQHDPGRRRGRHLPPRRR
jgi:hypothetical protein